MLLYQNRKNNLAWRVLSLVLIHAFFIPNLSLADIPENYKTVRYELSATGGGTTLTILQDNNASQEEAEHSEQNWKLVLEGIKKLLE